MFAAAEEVPSFTNVFSSIFVSDCLCIVSLVSKVLSRVYMKLWVMKIVLELSPVSKRRGEVSD